VTGRDRTVIELTWSALGGDRPAAEVTVRRTGPTLPSPLPVGEFAIGCVASALLAAAELAGARRRERPRVGLDADHVAASFTSERRLRVHGKDFGLGFGPLSTWMQTADGWVRTHANYPQHRAALLTALGLGDDCAEPDTVRARVAARRSEEVEEAIFAAGGCAAALRERSRWEAHPQGRALAGLGLLDLDEGADGAVPLRALERGELPAAGIRVLDLTRVIAGPVAGRTLAALGAEVLRIDAPGAVELELSALDGGPGKRSALLDLRTPDGRATFGALLAHADVLIEGYRPGALEQLGLGTREVARDHPNLVTASLSAWGDIGPWGERRGFDSLVQAASGIAVQCTPEGAPTPGALPAQALDHGTGHLIAAAVLRGLAHRGRTGRPLHARFALARTAAWLLDLPRPGGPTTGEGPDAAAYTGQFGPLTIVAPPGELDGRPLKWTRPPEPLGSSPARWDA
jgi:crotonobetainyl-CoA:carnitine CoA-transferase CaiB-like acyl-CoA transferase